LENIEGFPTAKIDTIGSNFIDKIVQFSNKFKLNTNNSPANAETFTYDKSSVTNVILKT
jgi:hypothetical protein